MEITSVTKEWLEKGYLLYLYLSTATGMYECKTIDPKYYKDSALENFRKNYTVNHKLYSNVEEMLSDRKQLNSKILQKIEEENAEKYAKKLAEEYAEKMHLKRLCRSKPLVYEEILKAYLAGLKEGKNMA